MSTVFVYITAESLEQAQDISTPLVEEGLAACTNILPGMFSCYVWEGEVQQAEEVVIIAKTTSEKFDALKQRVIELHSYDTPCVVALPVQDGHQDYLDWIKNAVS